MLVRNDILYNFPLRKNGTVSMKFIQDGRDYKELEFISFSPKLSPYRIFVSREETANSMNTMQIIPSWIGGYFTSVIKNSTNYCTNCNFTIFIEPEFEDAHIFFTIRYENSVSQIFPHNPIISTLKPFRKHCYFIDIPERFKNEDIIIQTELFSGSVEMLYNPWELPKDQNDFLIKKQIYNEDVTIINSTIRNSTSLSKTYNGTGSNFICLKSYDYTSYLLKVYFVSQTQYLQKFNFLFSGVYINGYLPLETVTKYRATEFTSTSDIFFKLKVISGNPIMYGFICENIRNRNCHYINKIRLDQISKIKKNLILNLNKFF
jgi:hypothetical protein